MTSATDHRPLRADAHRNRARLLETAHAAFVDQGVTASLDEIARRAGVGIGTLYRHFPTRDDLVVDLITDEIERLASLAQRLIADDVDNGVQRWLEALVEHAVTYRGLADTLVGAARDDSRLGRLCDRLHTSGAQVVRHAQQHRRLRADVDPVAVVDLAAGIAWITERDRDDWRRGELLRITLDGLRGRG